MGFSGTDLWHEKRFLDAAEQQRRVVMELMNGDLAKHGAGREHTYMVGRSVWEKAPNFTYRSPSGSEAWQRQVPVLGWLCVWFLAAAMAAAWAVRRRKVLP